MSAGTMLLAGSSLNTVRRVEELRATRARLSTVEEPALLVARYGTESGTVAALADVDAELDEPVAEHNTVTAAEVVWAVRHEGTQRRRRARPRDQDRPGARRKGRRRAPGGELVNRAIVGLESTRR